MLTITMTPHENWMTVHVVVPGLARVVASVDEPDKPPVRHEALDYTQRIGTATVRENGDIAIELFAIPTNGKLLLRRPGPDDEMHPWERRP